MAKNKSVNWQSMQQDSPFAYSPRPQLLIRPWNLVWMAQPRLFGAFATILAVAGGTLSMLVPSSVFNKIEWGQVFEPTRLKTQTHGNLCVQYRFSHGYVVLSSFPRFMRSSSQTGEHVCSFSHLEESKALSPGSFTHGLHEGKSSKRVHSLLCSCLLGFHPPPKKRWTERCVTSRKTAGNMSL